VKSLKQYDRKQESSSPIKQTQLLVLVFFIGGLLFFSNGIGNAADGRGLKLPSGKTEGFHVRKLTDSGIHQAYVVFDTEKMGEAFVTMGTGPKHNHSAVEEVTAGNVVLGISQTTERTVQIRDIINPDQGSSQGRMPEVEKHLHKNPGENVAMFGRDGVDSLAGRQLFAYAELMTKRRRGRNRDEKPYKRAKKQPVRALASEISPGTNGLNVSHEHLLVELATDKEREALAIEDKNQLVVKITDRRSQNGTEVSDTHPLKEYGKNLQ